MVKTRERLCAFDMNNNVTYVGIADFPSSSTNVTLDRKLDLILKRVIAYQTQGIVTHLSEGRVSGFKGDRKKLLTDIYNNSYSFRTDQISLNLKNYVAFYMLDR